MRAQPPTDPRGRGSGPLPGAPVHPFRRLARFLITRAVATVLVRSYARLRIEGSERLPRTPVLYCFNHMNWVDPIILTMVLPRRPRFAMFGPSEQDMSVGRRNRLMTWSGLAVPYKPGKNDLIDTARRVQAVFDAGWSLAIAGEGRIHRGERELLPLSDGAAYFALRNRVPIVPLAINGTSWLGFGRRIRVRFGEPIPVSGRPSREAVEALTAETTRALLALIADFPDPPPPGRFGRWLTDRFNEWPGGVRPELADPVGVEPAGVEPGIEQAGIEPALGDEALGDPAAAESGGVDAPRDRP